MEADALKKYSRAAGDLSQVKKRAAMAEEGIGTGRTDGRLTIEASLVSRPALLGASCLFGPRHVASRAWSAPGGESRSACSLDAANTVSHSPTASYVPPLRSPARSRSAARISAGWGWMIWVPVGCSFVWGLAGGVRSSLVCPQSDFLECGRSICLVARFASARQVVRKCLSSRPHSPSPLSPRPPPVPPDPPLRVPPPPSARPRLLCALTLLDYAGLSPQRSVLRPAAARVRRPARLLPAVPRV